jgi:hypothetical protein
VTDTSLIAEAEAALAGITPGPWEVREEDTDEWYWSPLKVQPLHADARREDDVDLPFALVPDDAPTLAAFIAKAPDLIARLVAALRAVEPVVAFLQTTVAFGCDDRKVQRGLLCSEAYPSEAPTEWCAPCFARAALDAAPNTEGAET